MVTIEINGKKVEVEAGTMLIAAADEAGIHIPRFCYHKKLSVAANCRMCLVDLQKAPKAVPACATPVAQGMVVFTQSPRAIEAQKAVMEFLLINHPLDCPICDQGGECELQDLALEHGSDHSQYDLPKRVVQDKNLGPLIETEMTRCIHCTRCVRFGTEIAGMREMGAVGRGEHMEIGTYLEKNIDSELSANIIDLCPVGALTSKPFRFSARSWELKQYKGIAPHDCMGSHVFWHTQGQAVKRVVPRLNEALNENWLSDRDRFAYIGLDHETRLEHPMIKCGEKWEVVSWEKALSQAAASFVQIAEEDGPEALAALIHPSATTEEAYLLQSIMRGLGSNNIDHRLRLQDSTHQEYLPLAPDLGCSLEEFCASELIILIGSNIRKEVPILSHRMRQAALKGTKIVLINAKDFEQIFSAESLIYPAGQLVHGLGALLKALLGAAEQQKELNALLVDLSPNARELEIAKWIAQAKTVRVVLGPMALMHPQYMQLRFLAKSISTVLKGTYGEITEGANSAGCWLAGAVPHRGPQGNLVSGGVGHSCFELSHSSTSLKGAVLVQVDPLQDCANGTALEAKLLGAHTVVAIASYKTPSLSACATILLPAALVPETSGSFVNLLQEWQSFQAAVLPPVEARPIWKILRVFGNLLKLNNFDYQSSEEVLKAVKAISPTNIHEEEAKSSCRPAQLADKLSGLIRLAPTGIYAMDAVLRHAAALQETNDAKLGRLAYLNPRTAMVLKVDKAKQIAVSYNDKTLKLALVLDPALAEDTILIEGGLGNTALGTPYAALSVSEV